MQVKTISVNKTAEKPEGVNINVVVPEGQVETDVMNYLLIGFLQSARQGGGLKMDLPDRFMVAHQADGSFLVSSEPGMKTKSGYYSPPEPLAIVALQQHGKRFDLAYAQIRQNAFQSRPVEPADAATPAIPATPAKA